MRTLHKLTHTILAFVALCLMSVAALAADPGVQGPPVVSDQYPGPILIYNYYNSSTSGTTNSRISITNADDQRGVAVHLFFIESGCSVADSFICLSQNQTMTMFASDFDPGVEGYIIAVATDGNGFFRRNARLLGDEQVRFPDGQIANFGAEALVDGITDISTPADQAAMAQRLAYPLPRVVAVSNMPSIGDGYQIKVAINGGGGDMTGGGARSTGNLFGLVYDELENPYSFNQSGGCFRVLTVGAGSGRGFPATSPRIGQIIPAGAVGWMKFWPTSDVGILGSVFFANSGVAGFNGGRNLHKLTNTVANQTLLIPVFPPNC